MLNSARGSDKIFEDSMEVYELSHRNKDENSSKHSKAIDTARDSENQDPLKSKIELPPPSSW
jgi:hypothetical protein